MRIDDCFWPEKLFMGSPIEKGFLPDLRGTKGSSELQQVEGIHFRRCKQQTVIRQIFFFFLAQLSWLVLDEREKPFETTNQLTEVSLQIEKALTDPSKSDIILIDVREPHEVEASGIIPTAYCLPANTQLNALFLDPEEFRERYGFEKPGIEDEDSEKDLVFYCKSGMRARNAARAAALAGYDEGKIGVYSGSWLDWSAKGGKSSKWERMQR